MLKIAVCPPAIKPLVDVINGKSIDATYIIQNYIASGLQRNGHDLTFIAPQNVDEIVCTSDLFQLKIAPQTWSASPWFEASSRAAWRFQQLLGVPYLNIFSNYRLFDACLQCFHGIDLVYERNSLFKNGIALACKRLELPYILYFEADDIMEHDFLGKPITGLLRWRARATVQYNLNVANCVICVSESGKENLVKNWGVKAEKVVVFPNAVDVHQFHPDNVVRSEIRASLGLGSNSTIMFVGSFYNWHDVATLLNAFALVLMTHPGAKLILVGEGEKRQEMMHYAEILGIGDNAQFLGQVAHNEIPRLMVAADIAVVPYPVMDRELWLSPLKLFEYMSSGNAVIASDVGQLPEIIHDGRNGLLVPPGDAKAMAEAMRSLIEDHSLRSRLGQNARADAEQIYSWERYIYRLESVFSTVIAGKPVNLL